MMLVTVEQKVSKNRISALPNQLRKSLEKSATVKVINSFVIFYWLNLKLLGIRDFTVQAELRYCNK